VSAPLTPARDDKDWTWVLDQPCPQCGFDTAAIGHDDVPRLVHEVVAAFQAALSRPDASARPAPTVWSPLEYGCHVRDVCRLYDERLRLMLREADPAFANWDQDETALEQGYWRQDPAAVASELAGAGEQVASTFAALEPAQWTRAGRRSDGAEFTVDSFARYFVHDLVHHVHDVEMRPSTGSGNLS
jgi:hypothetical protein